MFGLERGLKANLNKALFLISYIVAFFDNQQDGAVQMNNGHGGTASLLEI